jgi:hypothetical protein
MNSRTAIRLLVLCIAALFLSAACSGAAVQKAGDAKITITPPSGKERTAITIEGTGFKAGEVIDITIDLGGGQLVGLGTQKVDAIVADKAGAFKAPSGIPFKAKPGTYTVTAEGDKGSFAKFDLVVTP